MNWYALTTKSGQETRVAGLLGNRGLWVYLPTGTRNFFHRRKKVVITEFYTPFTGYLFAKFKEEDSPWKDIAECGARVLKVDGTPVTLPEQVIEEVLQAEESGLFDIHKGSQKRLHPFGIGDHVKLNVLGEEVQGFINKLRGHSRIEVNTTRYGRTMKAEVSASDVALV